MENEKTRRKIVLKQRVFVLLLASAVFLILLIAFNAQPAYAADHPNPLKIVPQQHIPDHEEPPSNCIEGWIYLYGSNCQPVSGINVYLDAINKTTGWPMAAGPVQTWSNGYFYFENGDPRFMDCIASNQVCYISINGWCFNGQETLGLSCDSPSWCQWRGKVTTDSTGYGSFSAIWLSPATVVNVPAAAIFSNTQYATVYYEMSGTHYVSHGLTFSVPNAGISVGYEQSTTATYSLSFSTDPNSGAIISRRQYTASYWDNTAAQPGVKASGISGSELQWGWDVLSQNEYLSTSNSDVVSNHYETRVDRNTAEEGYYSEQGSTTWSVTQGVPFADSYLAFGVNIDLNVVVTSSGSNQVGFKIDRSHDTNPNLLTFWIYTPGAVFNPNNHVGGMEFHIWDYSGGG